MTIPYGCVMTRYGLKRLTPKAWIRWQIRQHNARVAAEGRAAPPSTAVNSSVIPTELHSLLPLPSPSISPKNSGNDER